MQPYRVIRQSIIVEVRDIPIKAINATENLNYSPEVCEQHKGGTVTDRHRVWLKGE